MSAHHHAYIYEGPLAELPQLAESARKEFGFIKTNDPDAHVLEFEKFGIDEARELVHSASLTSTSGRALYIVGVSSLSSDAQQALLKLFEEPQGGSIFVLLAPHGILLPTLRSRMLEYPRGLFSQKSSGRLTPQSGRAGFQTFAPTANSFLQKNAKDRSAHIVALLKDDEMVKERIREFLHTLEIALYSKLSLRPDTAVRQGLEDIAKVRSYVGDRAPAMKMLLEHLAVSLPIIKIER
jgi:hypothetical protein